MRVIIATGIYPPDIGGPATYSKKIAEEFFKRGWDVKVLTYANLPQPLDAGCFKSVIPSGVPLQSSAEGRSRGIPLDGTQRECERPPERMDSSIRAGESTRTEGTAKEESFKVIRVLRAHNIFARYFLYTWNLCKLAKSADLIYAQGPVSEGLPAYLASKITGKKYVLKIVGDPAWERMGGAIVPVSRYEKQGCGTVYASGRKQIGCHSPNHPVVVFGTMTPSKSFIELEEFQDIGNLPLKTRILRWVERMVAKNAKKIITPSGYLKRIVMGWGIDPDKIKVVYNAVGELEGIEGREGREGTERAEGEIVCRDGALPRLKEEDIILSAGRLVSWKGFDLLIDIMPDLLRVNPNFKLVIVGDGPEMLSLKFKVQSSKFKKSGGSSIILTGKLEHEELLDLMRKSKIFVLNSGYEGLPHVVIEAMQAGLPCAVSNKGGNSELVENEKTGLLFEYNNREQVIAAIKRLWKDEDLRERVAAGGYEKIKKFGFERMIEETAEILEIGN